MTVDAIEDSEESLVADLEQFATFDRKTAWALAYLVARRVEPQKGTGMSIEQQSKWCARTTYRRISAREFARRTGTSHKRVMAYLRAWDCAATDGVVPSAGALNCGSPVELPDERDIPFFGEGGYYRGHEAYSISDERLERIERAAQSVGVRPQASAYVASHPKAVTAAIIADENTYKVAKKAFEEYERRQQAADHADREAGKRVTAERIRNADETAQAGGGATQAADSDEAEGETAILVFQELSAARLSAMRALALLKKRPVTFTEERSTAIAELCDTARVALDFVRDLATSSHTGLSDAALKAFLEESEQL